MVISLYWKALLALALVLFIILILSYVLKYFTKHHPKLSNILIEEKIALDSKRRIIVIKYQNSKYILLVGGNSDVMIKQEDAV